MLDGSNSRSCRQLKSDDLLGLHIVPALWSPAQDPTPFPFPENYRWDSLATICQSLGVHRAIACATPQVWQLEPLVYQVARAVGVPVILTPPQNLPIIKPFSEQVGIDLIIAAPAMVSNIRDILKDTENKPKAIIVIHKDTSTIPDVDTDITLPITLHELHLVPGLPLLFQEPSQSHTTDFKKNTLFTWQNDNGHRTYVSLPTSWPVSIAEVPLPFALSGRDETDLFGIV